MRWRRCEEFFHLMDFYKTSSNTGGQKFILLRSYWFNSTVTNIPITTTEIDSPEEESTQLGSANNDEATSSTTNSDEKWNGTEKPKLGTC